MIYIIRHGQTEMNRLRVLQGRIDPPLNEMGRLQAQEAAERLRGIAFDAVYSSPLIRAIQTAKAIAPGREPVIDARLIEMDCGPYDGMKISDLGPEVLGFLTDLAHGIVPAGMERLDSVIRRTGAFLEERCRTDANILISTHGIAMRGMLEYLTPASEGSSWSRHIGNCAVFIVRCLPDGTWSEPVEM